MIDLQPKVCNICGGEVIYTSNKIIYGREYGSGKCYYCTECGAFVGTHIPRPKEAFGILANKEMIELRKMCHEEFDKSWKMESTSKSRHKARRKAYKELAKAMNIEVENCHFGYFNMEQLEKAYNIITGDK